METFHIKQNDTKADLQVTLKDGDGVAVDVTGATIKFSMRHKTSKTLKVNEGAVTLVTAASGIVKYVWAATDTDTPGDYDGEFEVTFAAGGIQTFPNNREHGLTVSVIPEVA